MRDFNAARNTMEIHDAVAGDTHEMYYRLPTNRERAAYQAAIFKREGKKIIDRSFDTRVGYGRLICTGFKKGTFGMDGAAFASDPGDADYREDWPALLTEYAPDVLAAIAMQVFEGTGTGRGMDFEFEQPGEENDPLD